MPAAASPVSARSKQLLPAPTNSAGLQQKCVPASLGSVWLSVAAPARPADGSLVSGGSWLAPFSTIGRRQTLQQSGAQPLRAHCSRCGCLQSGSLVFSAVATRICSRQPRQWPGPTILQQLHGPVLAGWLSSSLSCCTPSGASLAISAGSKMLSEVLDQQHASGTGSVRPAHAFLQAADDTSCMPQRLQSHLEGRQCTASLSLPVECTG